MKVYIDKYMHKTVCDKQEKRSFCTDNRTCSFNSEVRNGPDFVFTCWSWYDV